MQHYKPQVMKHNMLIANTACISFSMGEGLKAGDPNRFALIADDYIRGFPESCP